MAQRPRYQDTGTSNVAKPDVCPSQQVSLAARLFWLFRVSQTFMVIPGAGGNWSGVQTSPKRRSASVSERFRPRSVG